jgi:hypothetical protein
MVISVAGVLVAGSAAALVNTRVLDNSAAPTEQSTPTTVAVAPSVTSPVVAAPAEAAQPASVSPAASAAQAAYLVGESGTVTLDTAGDVLKIVSVVPTDGWTVIQSESDGASSVEVKFQSGSSMVEFHANLLFGVVTTSMESDGESTTSDSEDQSEQHGGDDGGYDDNGGGGDD